MSSRKPTSLLKSLLELKEGFLIALRAINAQKLRSLLTTLGIIIGILSVTAMATVVNGIEEGFEQDMSTLGTDVLYIEKWPWGFVSDWWNYINRPNITQDLAEVVERRSQFASAATAVVRTSRSIDYKSNNLGGVQIIGLSSNYSRVHDVSIESGNFFSDIHDRSARDVAVLGFEVAERLFPSEQPLGKTVRIGGRRFDVIGVLEKEGSSAGGNSDSGDRTVQIPFTTFQKIYGTRYRDVSVRVKVIDNADVSVAKDEITGILRVARGLDAKQDDDFEINEQETLRAQIAPVKTAIYSVGIGLTALSLLVGGIGVMNIMFVSVKERTREIGIRKATGAKFSSILTQFLIEAILVCSVGGVIGVILSIPVVLGIRAVLPASLDATVVGIAFLICVLIGTIFGLAPAWKAARSEPIEALRYE
ncbi:MAG: FtsX-like permease family protein [Rhodothermales bacterium]|nr:FtsX-like permease family protein [Rhodothermales bacterium]